MRAMKVSIMMKMKNKKKDKELPVQIKTARDFTNVKDIQGNLLYTRDGYVIGYLRIYPFNLDLLTMEERRTKTNALSLSFDGDRKDFDYCTFPRQIDLDDYKNFLKELYQSELQTVGKRKLLQLMIIEANDLSTSGENYEHQHFIKLWTKLTSNENDAKNEIMDRLNEFKDRYEMIGVQTKILDEMDIIALCNLFANAKQAPFDVINSNTIYEEIPKIR